MKLRLLLLVCSCLSFYLFAAPTSEQYQGILDLVQSGEVEKAKIKVETYLEIFPGDKQLQQMAELLNDVDSAEVSSPQVSPIAVVSKTAEVEPGISSEDRLAIETVIVAAQRVSQETNASKRKQLAADVLRMPIPKASSSSAEWTPYWLARGVMALEADDLVLGWEAAQMLKTFKALESSEPLTRKVMAELNLKGWLADDLKEIEAKAEYEKWKPWIGTWVSSGSTSWTNLREGSSKYSGFKNYRDEITIEWINEAPRIRTKENRNERNSTWHDSGRNYWDSSQELGEAPGTIVHKHQGSGGVNNFTSTTKKTNFVAVLNDVSNKLTISYDSSYNGGETIRASVSYLLSSDETKLLCLGDFSGHRLEDFTKYGGRLFYEKNYGSFISPIIVAYQKQ